MSATSEQWIPHRDALGHKLCTTVIEYPRNWDDFIKEHLRIRTTLANLIRENLTKSNKDEAG